MNIVRLITRHAAQRSDQPALIDGDRSVTFAELTVLIEKTAGHLQGFGIKAGDRIGLSLKDNLDHVVAMLASANIGAAVVPIDWRAPPLEKQRLAEAFDVSVVLTEPGARAPDGVPCIPLDETWHASVASATRLPPLQTDGSHTFLLNLSSGTSGKPKGAIVTHDDYRYRCARYPTVFGSGEGYRYLSVMPLCFSGGRNFVLFNLMIGSTVFMYPTLFGPEEYLEAALRYDITFAFLVPTAVRWLLNLPEQSELLLPRLRVWGTGTAFMSGDEKREAARRISPNLVAGYSTSGTGGVSALKPSEIEQHADTVGRPFFLTTTQIVDRNDQPVPIGETGRVRVQGPGISRSYYGIPTDTGDEGIHGEWFYTGELGSFDEGGYLSLLGRSSSLIIRGGANIYPEEVEQVILAHDAVAEVAVIGRPSPELGEEVVAAVVTKRPVTQAELLKHCRSDLSSYKVPAEIQIVQSLPKTTSGKVKRREVLAQLSVLQPIPSTQE